jgi:hypothetical protein
MNRLWHTVDYFSCSSPKGLRNITVYFSQDNRRFGWESNQASFENLLQSLIHALTRSVQFDE